MQIIMLNEAEKNLAIEAGNKGQKESLKFTFKKQISKLQNEEIQEEQKTAEELKKIEEIRNDATQTNNNTKNQDKINTQGFIQKAKERKKHHQGEANQNRINAAKTIIQDINDPRENNNIFGKIIRLILGKSNL